MSLARGATGLFAFTVLVAAACGSGDDDSQPSGAAGKGGSSGSAGAGAGKGGSGGSTTAGKGGSSASAGKGGSGNATGGSSNGGSGGSTTGGSAGNGQSGEDGLGGDSNAGASATGGSAGSGGAGALDCTIPEAQYSCALLASAQCSEYYGDYAALEDGCTQSGGEWSAGPCPRDDLVAYCLSTLGTDKYTIGAFYYAENPAYQVACGSSTWCEVK